MAPLIRLVTLALVAVLTFQIVIAQSPPSGKYLIVPVTSSGPPLPPLGVSGDGPVIPVSVGGRDNIWTIQKTENGLITIIAEQTGAFTQADEGRVFVSFMPPPGTWRVQKQRDESYAIEVPSDYWPARAWTLDSTQPGARVRIGIMEFPGPGQLWKFVPVYD